MTKKNKNVNQYAVHYKSERPRIKKPKHAGEVKPVISKQKNGRMIEEPEVSDGSSDVIIFMFAILCLLGAIYAILKALNLI